MINSQKFVYIVFQTKYNWSEYETIVVAVFDDENAAIEYTQKTNSEYTNSIHYERHEVK